MCYGPIPGPSPIIASRRSLVGQAWAASRVLVAMLCISGLPEPFRCIFADFGGVEEGRSALPF